MNILKKSLLFFVFLMVITLTIACDGKADPTTITAPITNNTTASVTTGVTTDVTTDNSTGDSVPQFVGLFTSQSYYIDSDPDFTILDGVTAVDEEDGDITESIEVYGRYSLSRTGSYEVYVGVEDSDGNYIERLVSINVKALQAYSIPDELTTDDITISLWHSNGASIEAALKKYALEFQEIYPNVTVDVVKAASSYDVLRQNTVNAITAGTLPNIVQGYPDHVMEYIDNDAVIQLTPYIYNPIHGFNPDVEEESFMDILLSYRRENSQYTPDGEYYSLPFNKSTEVMIYNKNIMDALIEEGTITEVPSTWQDLFAIADDMKRVAVADGGVIDQIVEVLNQSTNTAVKKTPEQVAKIKSDFVAIAYDSPANAFITISRQWGGQYTGLSGDRKGTLLFDNAQTIAGLGYFFDNRYIAGEGGAFTIPSTLGTEYASDGFKTGQVAVTFGSTGGARYNTPTEVTIGDEVVAAFEYGTNPMPYNKELPGNRAAIQQGTNLSLTSAGTDQQKLASWLFLKYLTSKEVQLDFALITGYSPVRTSVYSEPGYLEFTSGLDSLGNTLGGEDLMKSRVANAAALQKEYMFYDQAFVGSSDTRTAVEDAFGRIILATKGSNKDDTIDAAIQAAIDSASQVIN
ncbi:MAG: extracellular solute-binding protein [Candidatus Izemoplasmatales bacterium]